MDTLSPPTPSVAAVDDLKLTDLVIDELLTGTGKSLIESEFSDQWLLAPRPFSGM